MKHLIIALFIAIGPIGPIGHAQTTIDTAIVIPTYIAPNPDGGIHIEGHAVVKVPYGTCDTAILDAETALHAAEMQLAADLGRTEWTPKSYARCYQEQWTVTVDPTSSTVEPQTCVRQFVEGGDFDWFGVC